jgi:hypothetical protein
MMDDKLYSCPRLICTPSSSVYGMDIFFHPNRAKHTSIVHAMPLGIIGMLLMSGGGAPTWFETVCGAMMWKLLIIEPIFQ